MKVVDLITELLECDPNEIVVLSTDAEGNHHSPVASVEKYIYVPMEHEIYLRELKEGYSEEDLYHGDDGVNAVVLYPV